MRFRLTFRLSYECGGLPWWRAGPRYLCLVRLSFVIVSERPDVLQAVAAISRTLYDRSVFPHIPPHLCERMCADRHAEIAWLSYDILLTAFDEATLIWTRKKTLAFPVFVAMRYLPLMHQLVSIVWDFTPWRSLSGALDAQRT